MLDECIKVNLKPFMVAMVLERIKETKRKKELV